MILQARYCVGRLGTCGRDLRFEKGGTSRLCAKCKKAQEFLQMRDEVLRATEQKRRQEAEKQKT